jgi:hypothetical protein
MKGQFWVFLLVTIVVLSSRAERFNGFLKSLDSRLPMNTDFMQWVLKTHNTRLAHPSLLERWGVINTEAAATYNGILNTVVLKEDYTVDYVSAAGKKSRRVKTWQELETSEPWVWSVRLGTIFHEISHAEYSWLPKSNDPEDKALLNFMNREFDDYLKLKYPKLNIRERIIARSEMFAYFRADFLAKLISTVDDLLVENGYFSTIKSCKNSQFFITKLKTRPKSEWGSFITFGSDQDFEKMDLPSIYVKGVELMIDPNDPITTKLKSNLWNQATKHFLSPRTKKEVIKWMNLNPSLRSLIKPCRDVLLAGQK